jgi:hypothetical protein
MEDIPGESLTNYVPKAESTLVFFEKSFGSGYWGQCRPNPPRSKGY